MIGDRRCFAYCGDGLCVCAASAESWAIQKPGVDAESLAAYVALNRLIDNTGSEYASEAAWRNHFDGPFDAEKLVGHGLVKKSRAIALGSMGLPDTMDIYTPCTPE